MLRRPRGSVTARHCLVSRIFTFAGALQVLRLTTPLVDHLAKKYIQPLIKTHSTAIENCETILNQRGAFLPSSSQLLCAPALSSVLQLPSFAARAEGTKRDFFALHTSYSHPNHQPQLWMKRMARITLSFFFLSGVMKPFLFFFPAA